MAEYVQIVTKPKCREIQCKITVRLIKALKWHIKLPNPHTYRKKVKLQAYEKITRYNRGHLLCNVAKLTI